MPRMCVQKLSRFTILLLLQLSSSVTSMSTPKLSECAVVGCGVLGTSLCQQMMDSKDFEGCKVVGITKTSNNHQSILEKVGNSDRFSVKTGDECKGQKFQNVVFCAPPSGFEDYPSAVEEAVSNLWAGPDEGGAFVFTSSGGIYGFGADAEVVTENSPVADPEQNPRSARLIYAEDKARKSGGACLRLAGLYNIDRGAHNFWITSGKDVSGRADGIINQLHYDDAAGSVMAALVAGYSVINGNNYLISDGNPMTREEICQSALKASKYKDRSMPKFLGTDADPKGKVYDGSASNKALKWDPRYASFDAFMTMQQ